MNWQAVYKIFILHKSHRKPIEYHIHDLSISNITPKERIYIKFDPFIYEGTEFQESLRAVYDPQTWEFQEHSICNAKGINTDLMENSFWWQLCL